MDDPAGGEYDGEGQATLPVRDVQPRGAGCRSEEPVPSADDDFSSLMAASMMDMPTILNTTSSPVSPGQSSPRMMEQAKTSSSFVPPARPSSTPFPHPENRSPHVCCLYESDTNFNATFSDASLSVLGDEAMPGHSEATQFEELPLEVHESVVDELFGFSISPTSSSAMRFSNMTRSWGSALRHSRRRELSNLALVNRRWTYLIQQRLYRHIKLKATVEFIEDAIMHFAGHQHLAGHVKHIEIWFPVFQPMYGPLASSTTLALPTVTSNGLTNATYILPENNCTLEEVFQFVTMMLPEAQVLTLEGGERRKAPKVTHFNSKRDAQLCLRPIESVRTLVTRGQWNLMRNNYDFTNILQALPNLEEWQGSYSKPKSKSYITVSDYLPSLPTHVTKLSLCMENDYRREAITPSFYSKVAMKTHICARMGQVLPHLEHFSYTGRVCHKFFDLVTRLSNPLTSRLKSVDLTIKNCCRDPDKESNYPGSGSGIHEMGFIEAFEELVVAAIRCLEKHKRLQYLRIRFVDLDSLLPPLNPYFLLKQQKCSGVWSDAIVTEMARVRPEVSFAEMSDSFGNIVYSKEGRMVISPENPRGRVLSLRLSNYKALANRMTIQ
ncbi:hypothetical protein TOPH_04327 [Tolypocladium ophioglossoides CBS 100239]|uniref:Uncharacterized protein n=1 Tax=Tolypocladium ophioglossoides (strain CBS 100239) TaxID=1163406 RepID=A0A0L0NAB7_TOLOC|nr:hypothetical protein TOPH_04327 [Tolypocladium ophioglossoides CBS 100239]